MEDGRIIGQQARGESEMPFFGRSALAVLLIPGGIVGVLPGLEAARIHPVIALRNE